MSRELR